MGKSGKLKKLQRQMDKARTFEEWRRGGHRAR